jgi:hypothetical protein
MFGSKNIVGLTIEGKSIIFAPSFPFNPSK